MSGYLIGVDGGNTKTDYFLFDTEGRKVDALRAGTCSHEKLPDRFAGTKRVLHGLLRDFLSRNDLSADDITAACFGMAGVDVPRQKRTLEEIVADFGFPRFVVANDGYLGIKAGTRSGAGVCSISGTATVAVGIGSDGTMLQVGGIGMVSGDNGGGKYLSAQAIQAVYNEAFRFGPATSLSADLFSLFGVREVPDLPVAIIEKYELRQVDPAEVVKLLFKHALMGDGVAGGILRKSGRSMARSVAGCVARLDLPEPVEIVLAGSVWAKAGSPHLFDAFHDCLEELAPRPRAYRVLQIPPATGAVLWAMELACGQAPGDALRESVVRSVEAYERQLNVGAATATESISPKGSSSIPG